MILKAFWQQKFDIKRLYKGSNVSDRGYNVFVNVAIDLRIILSRQMFMRFSKKSIKKNYNIIFKTKEGSPFGPLFVKNWVPFSEFLGPFLTGEQKTFDSLWQVYNFWVLK